VSATPAIHFLRAQKVPFTEHPYRYEERGGTLTVRTGAETDYWNNTFYGFKPGRECN